MKYNIIYGDLPNRHYNNFKEMLNIMKYHSKQLVKVLQKNNG
jgi:hypothetical protein